LVCRLHAATELLGDEEDLVKLWPQARRWIHPTQRIQATDPHLREDNTTSALPPLVRSVCGTSVDIADRGRDEAATEDPSETCMDDSGSNVNLEEDSCTGQ
jgi:hypothetical protein